MQEDHAQASSNATCVIFIIHPLVPGRSLHGKHGGAQEGHLLAAGHQGTIDVIGGQRDPFGVPHEFQGLLQASMTSERVLGTVLHSRCVHEDWTAPG